MTLWCFGFRTVSRYALELCGVAKLLSRRCATLRWSCITTHHIAQGLASKQHIINHHHILLIILQVNRGYLFPEDFLSPVLDIFHLTNSVKVPKETRHWPNQWAGLILSSSTPRWRCVSRIMLAFQLQRPEWPCYYAINYNNNNNTQICIAP